MADLFLSHSSSDVDAVRRLRRHLEAGGYSCWMAPDDVSSAGSWAQQIVDAIQQSHVTVVLLSERSMASEHVSREVGLAVQAGRPVLPVRIEQVTLSGTLAYLLHLTQWVDAFPGPIDSHINDIGGRVAGLVPPTGAGRPAAGMPGVAPTTPPPRAGAIPPPARPPGATAPGSPAASVAAQPAARPAAAPGASPADARAAASPLAGLGIIAGGIAVAVGSVLPWATETAGPFSRSLNGIDREGVGLITGLLGVILVVLGIVSVARRSRLVAVLALIAAVVIVLMGAAEVVRQAQLDAQQEGTSLALGFGLPVLIAGAIVAGASAAVALVRRS